MSNSCAAPARSASYEGRERRATPPPDDESGGGSPSLWAWVYIGSAHLSALAVVAAVVVLGPSPRAADLPAFAVLATLCLASQLFVAEAPNRHSYHATPAFLLASALLLPPVLYLPMLGIALGAEWIRYRYTWYVQTFNLATYLLNTTAAWMIFHTVAASGLELSWPAALGAALAGLVFTALNHAMVALVLLLARRIPLSQSGVVSAESLETDLALMGVGASTAVFWSIQPLLIVLQIMPLFLFYRALSVPRLEDEAYHDAKTGLLSARRFIEILEDHVSALARDPRPTTVIMADLDFFRDVNETLGHLAGDEVLRGVADVLRETLRQTDFVGRFGGEEFVALLPDTNAAGGLRAAERLRAAVEAAAIGVSARAEPVRVTLSLGVASFPEPCPDAHALLHMADLAVYRSKHSGRNKASMALSHERGEPAAEEGSPPGLIPSAA